MRALRLSMVLICLSAATANLCAQTGQATSGKRSVKFGGQATFGNYGDQARLAEEAIGQATKLIEEGQWYAARRALDAANGHKTDSQESSIRSLYKRIDNRGKLELASARHRFDEGQYAQAIEMFRQVQTTFGWLPSGVAARKAILQARKDPLVARALGDIRAAKLVETLDKRIDAAYQAATRAKHTAEDQGPAEPVERVEKILVLGDQMVLEVVKTMENLAIRYKKTPTGMLLQDDLDVLASDTKFAKRLAALRKTDEANDLLHMAEMYASAGRDDLAIKRLRTLIKKYPKTPQAETAMAKLASLVDD